MPSITNSSNVARAAAGADDGFLGYQYVVLRCVPRVEREEFVNVGVVLFAQSAGYLEAGVHLDRPRLLGFAPGLDLEQLDQSLLAVQRVCRGETGPGLPSLETPGQRYGWITASRSTVVQPGPRHGGVCRDPGAELGRLVRSLVSSPPHPAGRAPGGPPGG